MRVGTRKLTGCHHATVQAPGACLHTITALPAALCHQIENVRSLRLLKKGICAAYLGYSGPQTIKI